MPYTVPPFPTDGNPVEANEISDLFRSLRKYVNNYVEEGDLIGRANPDGPALLTRLDERFINKGSYLGVVPEHWFAFGKHIGSYIPGNRDSWCWVTGLTKTKWKNNWTSGNGTVKQRVESSSFLQEKDYQPLTVTGKEFYLERQAFVMVQAYVEFHTPCNPTAGPFRQISNQARFTDTRLELHHNGVPISCTRGYSYEEAPLAPDVTFDGVLDPANRTESEYQYFRSYMVSELIYLGPGAHEIQVKVDCRNERGYAACRSFSLETFYT